jgi:hypothetical protein
LCARQSRTPWFVDDTISKCPGRKSKRQLKQKKNIIFIPDHALDKKTRDNVSSLAV